MKRITILLIFSLLFLACKPEIIPPTPNPNPDPDKPNPPTPPVAEFVQVQANPRTWDGEKRGNITYQLLVYSFADSDGDGWGDIAGLKDKLEYINEMGASAVWLSPIHPSSSYHGYDVKDYSAVNEKFGTIESFTQFVQSASAKNIDTYIDYVINHSSKEHSWMTQATASLDNEYRDYYIFSEDPKADIAAGEIAMIATEGAGGYDSGQWYSIGNAAESNYKFTLNWSNPAKPTITLSNTTTIDEDNPDNSDEGAKYLYFGDGVCKKFYSKGNDIYELSVNFSSAWGFLVRTSNDSSWPAGTKYGGQGSNNKITLDTPFTLYTNDNNDSVANILMPGASMYHSHFWTESFADINYGSVETAENSPAFKAIVDDAKVWIDAGVAGMRLDAVKHIYHNAKSDENPRFLNKFYDAINQLYKAKNSEDIYMVGEVLSDAGEVAPYYAGLPANFEFSFWWRLKWALENSQGNLLLRDLKMYENTYKTYRDNPIIATKLSNHDENRTRSDLAGSLSKSKLAGAVLLTASGEPYIYYGEELGYVGKKENGDENVRTPMLWGDSYTTSYSDKIPSDLSSKVGSVVSQTSDDKSILNMYKTFAKARNTYPALATGRMEKHPVYNETNNSFKSLGAWYRIEGDEKVLVLHNFGAGSITVPLEDKIKNAIAIQGKVFSKEKDSSIEIKLEPYSSVVFEM